MLRARLRGGILNQARPGALKTPLPVGLVYDASDNVVIDPDSQVRQSIAHRAHPEHGGAGGISPHDRRHLQRTTPRPNRLMRPSSPKLWMHPLLAIATAGPNTVAIAGETHAESGVGSGVLEVFDGNGWQAQAVDVDSVGSLGIADDGSGWAFAKYSGRGRSVLLKRDGSKWAVEQLPDGLQSDMTDLEVWSETDGWAVGTDGVVLHMQDGTLPVERPSPRLVGFGVPAEFRAVAMIPPQGSDSTEVWAVGNWQTVLRRSSRPSSRPPPTTWTPVPVPVARVLLPWVCRPQ